MLIDESVKLKCAIDDAIEGMKLINQVIDAEIFGFVKRSRAERTTRREQIARAHQEKQRFSRKVLLYRVNRGSSELAWSEIYNIKGSSTIRYKRVPANRSKAHLARLRAGAHVDEVDLLIKHEAEARAYRQIYAQFAKARRAVNQLQKTYDMLSGRTLKAAMQGKTGLNEADSEDWSMLE